MPPPLISVCIPSYNIEKYIGQTIESVLSQTHRDFELVIVDDHSNDNTLDIIRRYNDSRIRVIVNKKNLGAQENWNKALKEAKGKYIKLLCHDDLLYPACLQNQLKVLHNPQNNSVVMVCSGRNIIDENDRKIMKRNFPVGEGILKGRTAIKKIIRYGTNPIGEPTAVLFKSEMVKTVGFFLGDIPYVIDLDYWCRMLLHGDLYVIPESLCAFRVFDKAWSSKIGYSQISQFIRFINKIYENKQYELNCFDCGLGKFKAVIDGIARNLLYLFILKDHSRSNRF